MKRLLKRPDYFLILFLTVAYLLGLIQAKGLGRTISLLFFLSGLFFMIGFYLVVTFAWPENQFSALDHRATRSSGSRTEPRILIMLAAIALTLVSLFFLIRAHFFEYLLIPSLLVLLVSSFMALNYSFRAQSMPYRWLLDSLSISPIAYFFGLLIAGLEVSFFPFMLAIPLFLIACGSTISLFFARFQEDLTQQQFPSMQSINWNRLAQLHDITAFMGYALLAAYLYFSGALAIAWPATLMLLAALGCSLLLHRIINGMHPNWKLLKAMAIVNFIGVMYLLGFAFLTH
ncbi:MAG TPA: hypothetical protein VLR89_07410 [Anaerolineaceae bacterium]|nr:hypothetical protein [Anaerolineaceae bacterium]